MRHFFEGKNVLITGGTRGIGRAIVEAFAGLGANVAFTFRSSSAEADQLARTVQEAGGKAMPVQADAADAEAAEALINRIISEWGSIDVLVNNAGVTRDGLLLRMSREDWEAVINTNLGSIFNYCKACYRPMMKQRAGRIINISSVVGVTGNAGQTNYSASKAGIIGFSKSLAKELGSRGVTVNVVAPGYIESDMTDAMPEAASEQMKSAVPLGRAGTPEDVAGAVLFLASEAGSYVSGHVLHVDGGLAM